jgi:hypothetical protein
MVLDLPPKVWKKWFIAIVMGIIAPYPIISQRDNLIYERI